MVAPLEPIRKEKSYNSVERNDSSITRSTSVLKRHESPIVNMNIVFRDGSAMPNSRSGSPSIADAYLVD